ncbi:ABC transporter, solute-binding protein [Mobiluncus mulieris 28-1]|nr:extracellular solute-binding protein [Mobiluncus mulieris]EEZ91433.1 ABC transporter, solute-binding protein [Mobiluncus mulieris 28-1]EFN93966.1 ABC transporter, solute-binding protein [Mobiluncus mulieris FB024-16]MCU9969557.1 extracellular solute-binding protein [Mobiluncus mulieris]MCU9971786.1 extracellular solute-binding protein [Mobiluncus mulieris]MCU9974055.1 extracellular solute-binding protein [Mobiluncus mulieris]
MLMTWKKTLGLAAAAAVALSMSACGGSGDAAKGGAAAKGGTENVNLSVWSPQEDQGDGSWLAKMEEAFEKAHSEYKITWKNDVVSEGDAAKKVKEDASAAADVYMFANDQLGALQDVGAIGELGENEAKQVKEQNEESMVASVTGTDGKIYGVPFTSNTWFMYYNSSKFSADDVKSLDAMLAKGKVSFPLDNGWYIQSFFTKGAGLTFFGDKSDDASKGITFADGDEAATAVTKYLVGLASNPNFTNDAEGSGLGALKAGDTDAIFSGTWDAENVKEALGSNYAAAKLPTFKVNGKDVQMDAFAGSKAVAYNPNAKNAKAAAQFAAFLGSTEAQKAHYEMRGIVPTDKSLASVIKADDHAAKAQMEVISGTSILQPTISAMGSWWDPAAAFGKGLVNKEITADNAGAKLADWSKQLAEMKG